MSSNSRFIVGIDLGTTTTEVSYIDTAAVERRVRQFSIPQLISAGEVGARDLLPSFCYFPGKHELPEGALELPWANQPLHYAVGEFARDHGAAVPGRLVASAKSWLAHGGVDRTSGILPWHGDLADDAAVSPVTVACYYLEHIRNAWDNAFASVLDADGSACVLSEQQVVLTVPASFDEAARELTVEAARRAGITDLVLLEEPLAAFYAWLCRHETDWQQQLGENERVLVIDIGGGTTDFSLIEIEPGYTLRRTAVGEHLLLGGDNIDMAIGRLAEKHWDLQLPARQWSMLCQQCRRAKEQLLQNTAPESVTVTVAGLGSSLLAGSRSWQLDAKCLDRTLTDGFFPQIDADDPGPSRRGGIREMGLPYVADPAVTRHLLGFLRRAAGHAGGDCAAAPLIPDRILFNGGSLLPARLRQRICAIVGAWTDAGTPVPELQAEDLHLAVSRGAAYYGAVRRGDGVRVKGGIARAYYLEVAAANAGSQLICVMPRDTQEGVEIALSNTSFAVMTNQPVRFPLYSSATRLHDKAGDMLSAAVDDISELPPLQTVISYGKGGQRQVQVGLIAVLNEVGTLDICCDTREGHHRYPLRFDLRVPVGSLDGMIAAATETLLPQATVNAACARLEAMFADAALLPQLMRELELVLHAARDQWSGMLLRNLADVLLNAPLWRHRSAEHETRWWNLIGFGMRPGFGAPADDWRIRELWKLWHTGVQFVKPQVLTQWWIAWRRVAAGLRAGQQQQIAHALIRELLPKKQPRLGPRKAAEQEAVEMWRCLGALERLPAGEKMRLLQAMLSSETRLETHHYWVMARLGSRVLFHGPANAVIPGEALQTLLPSLFKRLQASPPRMQLLCVARLCRLSGNRALDINGKLRDQALALLVRHQAPLVWQQQLQTVEADTLEQQTEMVGDTLPLGLVIAELPPESEMQDNQER